MSGERAYELMTILRHTMKWCMAEDDRRAGVLGYTADEMQFLNAALAKLLCTPEFGKGADLYEVNGHTAIRYPNNSVFEIVRDYQ